jgi:hypothetical protein
MDEQGFAGIEPGREQGSQQLASAE